MVSYYDNVNLLTSSLTKDMNSAEDLEVGAYMYMCIYECRYVYVHVHMMM